MKHVFIAVALLCAIICANAQANNPVLNFDPISVTTIAGTAQTGFADGPGSTALFNAPSGIATTGSNIYVADAGNNRIRQISTNGTVSTFAGGNVKGFADGPLSAAQFNKPSALAADAAGNLYVLDAGNNALRKINTAGIVSTLAIAGTGAAAGYDFEGGIAADVTGNVYFISGTNVTGQRQIAKITPAGIVSTFATNDPTAQYPFITDAQQLATDPQGNLYVQQYYGGGYGALIKVSPGGLISRYTAGGLFGLKIGIATDMTGNVYVSRDDMASSSTIYKVSPGNVASLLAGSLAGYLDATGTDARFNYPTSLCTGNDGSIFMIDQVSRIRKISNPSLRFTTSEGITSTFAYFTVSAVALNANASLRAPAGYELSLSASGPYTTSLDLTPASGEINALKVYIRLGANNAAGTYNDSVVLSAGNAITKKLGVAGVVTAALTGTGLQGVYYNGINLSGSPLLTRIDSTINFDLSYGNIPQILSPAPGIVPEDMYSVRWTGQVQAKYSETYTFYTTSDDGIRLWVNGVQLVDNWATQSATEKSGAIVLVAGQKYDIKIEYYENTGNAVTKLSWSSPSTPKAIIPASQLYPYPAQLPGCSINISPANGSTIISQTTATLTWNASAAATSYDVYIWSGATVPTRATANVAGTTYNATGLAAGTLYNWYIAPKNASGIATGCATANKTTFTTAAAGNQPAVPNAGSNVTITLPASSVALDGSASTGNIVQYYWYQPQGPAQVAIANNFSAVATATGLTSAGTYIFGLQVKDGSGVPAYAYKTVIVNAAGARMMDTSVQSAASLKTGENSSLPSVTAVISPNPVGTGQQAKLQINSNKAGTVMLNIVSGNGAVISSKKLRLVAGINTTTVDTYALAQGFHVINITGCDKPLNLKLVVQ